MRVALGVVLSSVAMLSACGGGGDGGGSSSSGRVDTLYVSVDYPVTPVSLFGQVTITPQLAGFQSYIPICSLANGTLPEGLQLRSDCTISGRPTEATRAWVDIRVRAVGVINTIDVRAEVQVEGPRVNYTNPLSLGALPIGSPVSDDPRVWNWTAAPDLSISWIYRLSSGSTLPTGLTLDPATGRISGTTQATGIYSAEIWGTLQTQFGTFETYRTPYQLNVNVPAIGYPGNSVTAYVSQPFTLAPQIIGVHHPDAALSGASVSPALPAGLSADDAGVISGTPTDILLVPQNHSIQVTLTQSGASAPTQGALSIRVLAPVSYQYGNSYLDTAFGIPMHLVPDVIQHSPVPLLPGATRTFTPQVGYCWLPPGLSIHPTTGALSGTPTTRGNFSCHLDVVTTNNGVSWNNYTTFTIAVL